MAMRDLGSCTDIVVYRLSTSKLGGFCGVVAEFCSVQFTVNCDSAEVYDLKCILENCEKAFAQLWGELQLKLT